MLDKWLPLFRQDEISVFTCQSDARAPYPPPKGPRRDRTGQEYARTPRSLLPLFGRVPD